MLVYDLGGGTFDVSVAQVEKGVVEILSSHGDTQLGGDDFDQLLLDHVCDAFSRGARGDRSAPIAARQARLLHAVEEAKKRLSFRGGRVDRGGIHRREGGLPLHLNMEIIRAEFEELIHPLLMKTLRTVSTRP